MKLVFCTTNAHKFDLAQIAAKKSQVDLRQLKVEVEEIQSENPMVILERKVKDIYKKVGEPLFVTDDSWNIPALSGFPGPYMKSVNQWFTPEDWLNLMKSHDDKRVFLERRLAYIEGGEVTFFEDVRERKFLTAASEKDGISILKVTSMKDSTKPINEILLAEPELLEDTDSGWKTFFDWYKSRS